jgi:glycosidase
MKKILFFAAALLLMITVNAQTAPFDHVEPPFWWAGMKHEKLQLLVHGDDISHLEPRTDAAGVVIEQVRRVSNPNYLFIDLDISDVKPGSVVFHFHDKSTRAIIDLQYEFREREAGSAEREGFSSEDVLYLLMPDRFANGDPSNDSHPDMREKADRNNPNGRHGGDLKGIIDNLDYISDMGFTALWLNPYQENNNPEYSYHGYAITDFYNTDPRIGTNEDYLELVELSHQKGIKVIMDYILNHSSLYHWFIEDLPADNWIHQHEEFTYSNFRGSAISDPYASEYDLNQMLTGWFDRHMPDLDQRNELLSTYLIQNTIWWIEYSGIDGIRLDTQPYPYKEMVADWAERIFYEYPKFNVVGEAWLQKEALTAYFQETSRGKYYNSNIPSITDFPLHGAINNGLRDSEGWNTGLYAIYYTLAQDFVYPDPFKNVIFLDNHDVDRFSFLTNQDMALYKMGVAMILTMRGIPQVYYGTELLMDGDKNRGHGYIRQDYPGGWENDEISAFTGEGLDENVEEARDFMKKILNWRKTSEVIHNGSFKHFLPVDQVYLYAREYNGKSVVVIVSKNDSNVKFNYSRYQEVLGGAVNAINIIDDSQVDLNNFTILPDSVYILEIK